MLADDQAAAHVSRPALARALVAIGGTATPGGGSSGITARAASSASAPTSMRSAASSTPTVTLRPTPTLDRVQRLARPRPPADGKARLVETAAWLAALALVAGPTWLVLR